MNLWYEYNRLTPSGVLAGLNYQILKARSVKKTVINAHLQESGGTLGQCMANKKLKWWLEREVGELAEWHHTSLRLCVISMITQRNTAGDLQIGPKKVKASGAQSLCHLPK